MFANTIQPPTEVSMQWCPICKLTDTIEQVYRQVYRAYPNSHGRFTGE